MTKALKVPKFHISSNNEVSFTIGVQTFVLDTGVNTTKRDAKWYIKQLENAFRMHKMFVIQELDEERIKKNERVRKS